MVALLRNLKLLRIGAVFLGIFTLSLGIFTEAYFLSYLYPVSDVVFTSIAYLIGGGILIVAGARLIWRKTTLSVHFTSNKEGISVHTNNPNNNETLPSSVGKKIKR